MMQMISNKQWAVLGLVLALGLGYVAGGVAAKPDAASHDGVLVLTTVAEILNLDFKVQVKGNDVFAVRGDAAGEVRLLIRGGKGLVGNGTLSDGDLVRVTGKDKDKKQTHRGHVTVLK